MPGVPKWLRWIVQLSAATILAALAVYCVLVLVGDIRKGQADSLDLLRAHASDTAQMRALLQELLESEKVQTQLLEQSCVNQATDIVQRNRCLTIR